MFKILRLSAAAAALCASAASAQNLLSNPGFTANFDGWNVNGGLPIVATWSSDDAAGSPASGSVLVTDTDAVSGALLTALNQCVAVTAGVTYQTSADVLFPGGQSSAGSAEILVYWTQQPGCNGFLSGVSVTQALGQFPNDAWNPVAGGLKAPDGAASARVQLGILKTPAGGSLAAKFDNVVFAPEGGGASDALVGYIPGAGSLPGSHGANFKTSSQVTNPGDTPITVRLVYHPAGQTASDGDPHTAFDVAPGATVSSDDFVAALGQTGLGTVDVFSTVGGPTPAVVARVYTDGGAAGTSGFAEDLVALPIPLSGTAVLIGPIDTDRFRFHVGARTFARAVHLQITVRDGNGNVVHTQQTTLGAGYFQQLAAHDFLNGFDIGPNHSIVIDADGPALFYGATTDNTTNDPSVRVVLLR